MYTFCCTIFKDLQKSCTPLDIFSPNFFHFNSTITEICCKRIGYQIEIVNLLKYSITLETLRYASLIMAVDCTADRHGKEVTKVSRSRQLATQTATRWQQIYMYSPRKVVKRIFNAAFQVSFIYRFNFFFSRILWRKYLKIIAK